METSLRTLGFAVECSENGELLIDGSDIFSAGSVRLNLLESLFRLIDTPICNIEFAESDITSPENNKRLSKLARIAEFMAFAPSGQGLALVHGGEKTVATRKFLEAVVSAAAIAQKMDTVPRHEETSRAEQSCRVVMTEICKRAGAKSSGGLFSLGVNTLIPIPPQIASEISKRRVDSPMSVSTISELVLSDDQKRLDFITEN